MNGLHIRRGQCPTARPTEWQAGQERAAIAIVARRADPTVVPSMMERLIESQLKPLLVPG